MPKRQKTPPPSEDEPRYLVVVHPYPLNANLQLHADRRALALWLACCTGKDALYAMYYKPASPGMVIIEVDRYFDRFDSLLGMHRWSSFLKNPAEEDRDKASKIFWCHYNTGRTVQKNGWKRVDIEEHWFHGWTPSNNVIKHPYPKTSYCDVPAEAQTGVPLCRPLPKDTFTPPPPRPRPTVGSAEWINSRSSKAPSEAPSSSRRRRGDHGSQIAPSDSASMISAPSDVNPRRQVSQWVAKQRASQPVWPRAPSTISSSFTLSSSTASSSVGSRTRSALGANLAAASVPAGPPGLPSAQSSPTFPPYEKFDWSDEVEIRIEAQQDDVATSPQSPGASTARAPGGRTAPPRRAPAPKGAIDPDQDYEYEEEDVPKRSTGDAMRDIFDGAPPVEAAVGNDVDLQGLEEQEEDWNHPQAVRTTTRDWTPAGGEDEYEYDAENPWHGYDAPRWEPPTKVNIKGGEKWVCSKHGPTCNPGICKERAHDEFERRKAKETEERLEARRKREEKWKKDAEKKKRRLGQTEGREVSHDLPPHFPRYRGADGSGSDNEDSGSDSLTGSESQPSLQDGAGDAEGWAEEGSLWDEGENADPKVSLPGSSGWSVSGSNRVEGEDEARSVGGPRAAGSTTHPNNNNSPSRQHSARSAAASTNAWSTSVPSARGDVNSAQASASERPQLVRPGDARDAAGVRPAAASSWGDDPPVAAQSPEPGPRQSAWGARGSPSLPTTITSARGASSQWPAPGQSQSALNTRSAGGAWATNTSSDAAPAPWSSQDNGRRRDDSTSASPTFSDHRSTGRPGAITTSSSLSSEPRSPASMSRAPTSPPGIFLPVDGGFPTFADTAWGDPIAVAQSATRKRSEKSTSASGTSSAGSRSAIDANIVDGRAGGDNGREALEQDAMEQNDRTGRGRGRGNRRGGRRGIARRTMTAPAAAPSTSQEVAHPNVLEVSLPPGGPGAEWSNENVEW